MTEKRAQIAFAPVDREGVIATFYLWPTLEAARRAFANEPGWREAEATGWRIRKVKIEVVDD